MSDILNLNRLILVKPSEEYKEQVMNIKRQFLENNEEFSGCSGLEECDTYEEWTNFEERLRNKYKEKFTPVQVFLAVRKQDNKVVGIIDCRLCLSDFLYNYGGHIGYSIVIDERRKGYGKEMLNLALHLYKKQGINRVLITCDKGNIASARTIIANGGIFENEVVDKVGISSDGFIHRYWISLKKKFANSVKDYPNVKKISQKLISIESNDFKGDVYLNHFIEVKAPIMVGEGLCIQNDNYKWLEFYDYSSKIRLTAMYDEKNEIIEWYFDIARMIGKENENPYEDDLYLDVILTQDGNIILLDEDELKEAFERRELTKEQYNETYKIANDLINNIKGKVNEIKAFTDKY